MKNVPPGISWITERSTLMGQNLLLRCLLPTLLGVVAMGNTAEATVLEEWQFEADQNRLTFTTEGGVQPKAQLIPNPTRLVIDLPGTTLGNIRTSQVVGGGIKAVRVGQLDAETARIVVELNPGYTVDPNQVKFRGKSPSEWTVELPTPQSTNATNPTVSPEPEPARPPLNLSRPEPEPEPASPPQNRRRPEPEPEPAPPPQNRRRPEPAPQPAPQPRSLRRPEPEPQPALRRLERRLERRQEPPEFSPSIPRDQIPTTVSTLIQDLQVRDNGIVMLTSGKLPLFELKRGMDGSWMTVDIMGARLIAEDIKPGQLTNRSGLTITQATQLSNSPPVVRVTLSLPDTRKEWQARAYAGGLAIWPEGGTPPTINEGTGFASIESVELKNGTELVLTADRQVNYTSGWDPEEDAYGITIFNAKVSDGLRLPGREVGSPLLWVRLRREDPETVTLLVKPATRIELGDVTQVSPRQLSLPMGWGEIGQTPPGWRPSRDRQPAPRASNPLPTLWPGRRNSQPRNPQPSQQPNLDSFPGGPRRDSFPWPRPRRNEPQPQNRSPFPWPAPTPQRDGRVSIVIDPGHGGPTDLGGVGIGGLREKDIVLPMSLQVAKILEENGIQVIMTRTTDRDLDLPPRTELANRVNADLFVSIHANAISMSRPDVNGLETFYYQTGRQLAEYIQRSMLDSFPTMNDRGVRRARFYVLRNTAMPAALVEVGFVTGNYDSRILADPVQRSRMAQAVARGILNYVNAYYR